MTDAMRQVDLLRAACCVAGADGETSDSERRVLQRLAAAGIVLPPHRIINCPYDVGAARNAGWRAATTPFVWFVDSDCVASPDALERLLPHLEETAVGGVSAT